MTLRPSGPHRGQEPSPASRGADPPLDRGDPPGPHSSRPLLTVVRGEPSAEELAQLVGASRETVNKALADFVHRGWIQLQGKSVVVLDEERLRRRAR